MKLLTITEVVKLGAKKLNVQCWAKVAPSSDSKSIVLAALPCKETPYQYRRGFAELLPARARSGPKISHFFFGYPTECLNLTLAKFFQIIHVW